MKDAPEAPLRYSPSPEESLRAGSVLVVLGEVGRIGEARTEASGNRAGTS
jgi:K+/H+ antiporter YhaU regulatory subunit KhtT